MAYLSGYAADHKFFEVADGSTDVELNIFTQTSPASVQKITGLRQKQTIDQTQVGVCGTAWEATVTGAYDVLYTVDFAMHDGIALNNLAVGQQGVLQFTYTTGKTFRCPVEIVDSQLEYAFDGECKGTLELAIIDSALVPDLVHVGV